MKYFTLLTLIFTHLTLSAQQTSLQGNVYEYIEKGANKTLSQVSITAPYSQGAKSGSDGKYSLVFDNEARTTIITVFKPGYELVNKDKDAYNRVTVDLSLVKQFHIYLDKEGNWEKRRIQLEAAYDLTARKKRDLYYTRIDKGNTEAEKVKAELEKQSGKSFRDIDDVKSYIAERYGANKKIIQDLIPSILQQNLDHSNHEVEKIKRLILEGKEDSILKIINAIDFKKDSIKAVQRNNQIVNLLGENKKEKEKLKLLIPSMISDALYEKVANAYRQIILLDTSDLQSYFDYALFLQIQNQFAESRKIYEDLVVKTEQAKNEDMKATIFNNFGLLLTDIQQYSLAEKILNEALEINRKLSLRNPDIYLPHVGNSLNNLGLLLINIQQYNTAQKNYEEALDIKRKLALKNPDVFLSDVAASLNNLGILLSIIQQYGRAQRNYEEALDIRRKLALKNSDVYSHDVAVTLNNLGSLLRDIQQYGLSQKNYEEALDIYRKLALKNPDKYLPELANSLNNYGVLLRNIQQFSLAQKNYMEALDIRRKLALKNPDAYLPDVAVSLNNLGALFGFLQQNSQAQKKYEEALDIRRKLALINPDAYLPKVGNSLNNLGNLLIQIQQYNDALKNYEEALSIRRKLTLKNPDVYLPELAISIDNLGNLLNILQQYPAAQKNYEEALEIRKKLALKNPDIYTSEVAKSLNNLGSLLNKIQQYSLAQINLEEALDIYRKLALKSPDVYIVQVATLLNNLGSNLTDMHQYNIARKSYEEALDIRRKLAVQNPDVYEQEKVETLENLCQILTNQKLYKEAVHGYKELLDYYNKQTTNESNDFLSKAFLSNYKLGQFFDFLNDSSGKNIFYYAQAKIKSFQLFKDDSMRFNNSLKIINYSLCTAYGKFAWYLLFQKKYDSAEINAQLGLTIDSTQSWIRKNLAHALLLQGKYNVAFSIYESMKHTVYPNDNSKTFGSIFLMDLQELEEKNAISPNRKKDILKIKEMLKRE